MTSKSGFAPLWLFVMAFALTLFATHSLASGGHDDCHHDCGGTTTNINNKYLLLLNKDSDNTGAVIVGTVGTICFGIPAVDAYVVPAFVGLFTWRWPRWKSFKTACWPDRKPEPLPDPGPVVKTNDVTPANVKDEGSIYLFKGR